MRLPFPACCPTFRDALPLPKAKQSKAQRRNGGCLNADSSVEHLLLCNAPLETDTSKSDLIPVSLPSHDCLITYCSVPQASLQEIRTEHSTARMSSSINGYKSELQRTDLPPGGPGKPYVISSQDGEIIYIPLSKSATRLLVTGKESENAFAVVASGGSHSDPIGFHYHRETHDVFLCLQGSINVWADDKCRTMTSGDFASVPPVSTTLIKKITQTGHELTM